MIDHLRKLTITSSHNDISHAVQQRSRRPRRIRLLVLMALCGLLSAILVRQYKIYEANLNSYYVDRGEYHPESALQPPEN